MLLTIAGAKYHNIILISQYYCFMKFWNIRLSFHHYIMVLQYTKLPPTNWMASAVCVQG